MDQSQQENIVFNIEKIYIKDISYEAPSVPSAFIQAQNAAAEIGIQLGVEHGVLNPEQGIYEVALTVTATAKREDKNLFLVEVKQAGIFRIGGVEGDTLQRVLEISCAYVLLPFVRETINDLVGKGGFPQLLINPINFETLFDQKQAAQASPPSIN
ncbi:protein-export chaperone SecB [Sulfuricaulis sp.]|uniref:protein-export chaperone SecB n=1 Tax=Sulfuricaulis sp. TaxID=2003553 RepID=UPI003559922D